MDALTVQNILKMNKREKHEAPSKEKKVKRVKTHHSRPNVMNLAPVSMILLLLRL